MGHDYHCPYVRGGTMFIGLLGITLSHGALQRFRLPTSSGESDFHGDSGCRYRLFLHLRLNLPYVPHQLD